MVVTVSHAGYVKRTLLSTYRTQNRGGRGRSGMETKDEDFVVRLFAASTHAPILFFSSKGIVYREKVWRLPLEDELRDKMKSDIADLHNSSPYRFAHAGTGAAYLSFFVGSDAPKSMPTTPWIHLDIAGTAVSEGGADWDGLYPKGPTGWGVRTLVRLIADYPA
ncbi:MAG: hypothetical protein CFE26_18665 [Verrucomicrobiales bacterium VVV1]|nr:MAG: hypothetical protein CFE26_18665 [Verrucomicrobiales bacterium VVV1]